MSRIASILVDASDVDKADLRAYLAAREIAFVTEADYGADNTGAVEASTAINDAITANDWVIVPEGSYKIDAASINMASGKRLDIIGDLLTTSSTLTVVKCDNIDDFVLNASGSITGNGNTSGTAIGLLVKGCNRYQVNGAKVKSLKGTGFKIEPGTHDTPRGDQGQWSNCLAHDCYVGWDEDPNTGAEYNTMTNCSASGCTSVGIKASAGNTRWIGGNVVDNQAGVLLEAGSNHGHGGFVGTNINHNTDYNLKAVSVTNGYTFTGCHFYGDSTSAGYIWINGSKGINISGGIVDSPIYLDGSCPGVSQISGAFFPGTYAVVGGSDAAKLLMSGNFNGTGAEVKSASAYINDVSPVFVGAYRQTTDQTISGATDLIFNYENYDNRAAHNASTGVFTAPWDGWYEINVTAWFDASSSINVAGSYISVIANGVTCGIIPLYGYSSTRLLSGGVASAFLTAGQTMKVQATISGSGTITMLKDLSFLRIRQVT